MAMLNRGRRDLGGSKLHQRHLGLNGLWLFALLASGCGPGHPQTVPVHGQLRYGGGDWPAAGNLYFIATKVADGFPQRPGTASFAKDGIFSATTFRAGDGLIPGEYQVNIECWKTAPSMDGSTHAVSYVPDKFQSGMNNGFRIVVPRDKSGAVDVKFDVPRK